MADRGDGFKELAGDGDAAEAVETTVQCCSSSIFALNTRDRMPKVVVNLDTATPQSGEEELASKTLFIAKKRFYLDVKQNRRGRFIKITEVALGGRKNRLLFAMSAAGELRDHLAEFVTHEASLAPANPERLPEDGLLKSVIITRESDNKRYYLDLKENQRGRFLRLSQTINPGGYRSQVAVPAHGLQDFHDAINDLLQEFGTDDHEGREQLPESRAMRVENKTFYFDVLSNRRGVGLRISEVTARYRTAITIPQRAWSRVRDILNDFAEFRPEESSEEAPPPQPPPTASRPAAP